MHVHVHVHAHVHAGPCMSTEQSWLAKFTSPPPGAFVSPPLSEHGQLHTWLWLLCTSHWWH